jgi:predicted ABC-type ATPase
VTTPPSTPLAASPSPVLHLLAGSNGSGKSTFVERVLQPRTHLPFVNADVIAAHTWPGEEEVHAYDASRLAAQDRDRLLSERASFISETVFSHPSKLDLVREAVEAGYLVHLHVVLIPEDTSVRRVEFRVTHGGHSVPEAKIRQRYARLWSLVAQARYLAAAATFYDNSRARHPYRIVAAYEAGVLIGEAQWPSWTPGELL